MSQVPAVGSPRRGGAIFLLLLGIVLVLCGLGVVGLMAAATTAPDFSWDEEYVPIMYTFSAAFLFIALVGALLIRGALRRLRAIRAAA
jgi:hypothetical protein